LRPFSSPVTFKNECQEELNRLIPITGFSQTLQNALYFPRMAGNFFHLASLSTSAGCDIPGSLSEEISTSVLGRFENIIDFSHISLRPLSVPHVTELRGVTIPYQFHVVMYGWHLLVPFLENNPAVVQPLVSAAGTFLFKL
jgi:hypothetical protein